MPSCVLEIHQLELRLLAELLVERGERLVEQQEPGTFGERPRQSDALALAAGELAWIALRKPLQLHQPQHLPDALRDFSLRQPVLLQAETDVPLDAHMREQRVGLEHHVHGPAIWRHARKVAPAQGDGALARLLEAGEHPHQRCLATTGRPEQAEKLALEDIERQIIHRDHIAEPLRHVLDADEGFGCRIRPGSKRSSHGANGGRFR